MAGAELHQMGRPIARRELHEAEPVAQVLETHRLRVDGDGRPQREAVR